MFSFVSEECEEFNLKRMLECAGKGNKIWDLKSLRCFGIGKRGPCPEGELFFLNRDSDVSLSMLFLDAIASVGLHMSVCLSVFLSLVLMIGYL